jgi:hypothetical protein
MVLGTAHAGDPPQDRSASKADIKTERVAAQDDPSVTVTTSDEQVTVKADYDADKPYKAEARSETDTETQKWQAKSDQDIKADYEAKADYKAKADYDAKSDHNIKAKAEYDGDTPATASAGSDPDRLETTDRDIVPGSVGTAGYMRSVESSLDRDDMQAQIESDAAETVNTRDREMADRDNQVDRQRTASADRDGVNFDEIERNDVNADQTDADPVTDWERREASLDGKEVHTIGSSSDYDRNRDAMQSNADRPSESTQNRSSARIDADAESDRDATLVGIHDDSRLGNQGYQRAAGSSLNDTTAERMNADADRSGAEVEARATTESDRPQADASVEVDAQGDRQSSDAQPAVEAEIESDASADASAEFEGMTAQEVADMQAESTLESEEQLSQR